MAERESLSGILDGAHDALNPQTRESQRAQGTRQGDLRSVGDAPTKRCPGCGKEKPLDAYWRRKRGAHGRAPRCKDCYSSPEVLAHKRELMRRWRERNRHRALASDKNYRARNPVKQREKGRRRSSSPHGRASQSLRDAVRAGRVVKPPTCEECGKGAALQGHHVDYSKPFEVEWLCSECHGKRHRTFMGVAA